MMMLRNAAVGSLLTVFLCACGGSTSNQGIRMSNELAAQIDAAMAPYGEYTLMRGEGVNDDLIQASTVVPVSFFFDDDGEIPKFEANIPLELLPGDVREAATAAVGLGDTLSSVELVYVEEEVLWKVKIVVADGSTREIYFESNGDIASEN